MRKLLVSLGVVMTLGGVGLVIAAPAAATQDGVVKDGKAQVCKYVGTPGESEVLQTGQNPIEVSVNAIDADGVVAVGDTFTDAQGFSVVVAIAGQQGVTSCEGEQPPTTTTTVVPPTCEELGNCETTTTVPPTCEETQTCETTTTEPPVTTTTEPPVVTTTTAPPVTTTTETTAPPTTTTTNEPPKQENDGPDKTEGPGKLAFTGPEDLLPLGLAALGLLSTGTGLMWAGRRRDED